MDIGHNSTSKTLFHRNAHRINYFSFKVAIYLSIGLKRSTASQMAKTMHSVKCSTTQKFNPRFAKNTQCSNSRFNPLKLTQTYNPTTTHRKWLRSALKWKIEVFPTYLYFNIN